MKWLVRKWNWRHANIWLYIHLTLIDSFHTSKSESPFLSPILCCLYRLYSFTRFNWEYEKKTKRNKCFYKMKIKMTLCCVSLYIICIVIHLLSLSLSLSPLFALDPCASTVSGYLAICRFMAGRFFNLSGIWFGA